MSLSISQKRKLEATKFRGTGMITDEAAGRYGPELMAIAAAHGGTMTPHAVVEAARPKASALHEWVFRYSDAEAVEQHRLERATYLVRHVVEIIVDAPSGEEVQVRPFPPDTDEDDAGDDCARGYRERTTFAPATWHENRLDQALGELRSFVRRFADLPETRPVTQVIRKVLKLRGERL